MSKNFKTFFPRRASRKRRALAASLLALASVPVVAEAQAPGRLVIPRATRVDIGHTGIHTHANSILFETGAHDLAAMQADPADFPHLTLKAHSRLPTDHASLPPGLAMPGDPPLDNPYGPMDGGAKGPGWGVFVLHQGGRNTAKVVVPTRFANWVALQPPARRRAYLDPHRYWLEARWEPTPVRWEPTPAQAPTLPKREGGARR